MNGRHFVIAFDVCDNRRRRQLTKLLLNYSYRVQYSVFEMCTQSEDIKKFLEEKIRKIVDEETDSVIIYEFGMVDWPKKVRIGNPTQAEKQYESDYLVI